MSKESPLHIGKTIRKHLEEKGMTKSEFARRISTSPQNVYGIFKRKSIDSDLLKQISICLDFDFFQYYSTTAMVGPGQEVITAMDMKRELDQAKKDIELLRNENEYLKEIHRLLKEKPKK